MSIEDLLKDRYKVIADYPDSVYYVGQVLTHIENENWNEFIDERASKYPHLFKKLSWWEERDLEDLPEYIRFYEPLPERFKIGKIEEWRRGLKSPIVKVDFEICYRELSILDKPATKEEYESYLKQKQ